MGYTALISAAIPLVQKGISHMSGGGGKGAQGGGTSAADLGIPPGFRDTTRSLGKNVFAPFFGPGGPLATSAANALSFYNGPDMGNAMNVFRADMADPTKLTDPLFRQQRESLAGDLIEKGRQVGGLDSSYGAQTLGYGLGDFTNQYLNSAYQRRESAATGLAGLGQQLFTPFQAFTGAMSGFTGHGNAAMPQFGNPWAGLEGAAGTALGGYLGGKGNG